MRAKEKKPKKKNDVKLIIIALLVIFLVVAIFISINQSRNYISLKEKYSKAQKENKEYINTIETQNTTISDVQNQLSSFNTADYDNQIASLNSEISNLTAQRDSLQSEVIQLDGQPQNYSAGYYTAGTNFPTGRYKIYDGNSNFIVYSMYDRLKVNIILGDDTYDTQEYIYEFEAGDEIQSDSSFSIVKVK